VGDVCHTLPVVRTIQACWPETKITWIIGKAEASLIGDIPDINFVVFDKRGGLKSLLTLRKTLLKQLADNHVKKFDALLHMQMSLRSSLINRLVPANIRIGFDRDRAKDLQWLFNNASIPARQNQHVMESFFGFAEALGIHEQVLRWDIPVSGQNREQAETLLPGNEPTLIISPCSSMAYRNWTPAGYAAVSDYAVERYGLRVVLTGGPSEIEQKMGLQIVGACKRPVVNLIGKTSLKQLLPLFEKSVGIVSPDSGPAHMAAATSTPVIGLYACTNPDRARPWFNPELVVDRYHEAVLAKHGRPAAELAWGIRVRDPGTMERILVSDVTEKLDLLMSRQPVQTG
jgi:heptosyltransferase I